jgi:sigma-B regulation protein RsbU (phosphoserine phosphatase)
MMTSAKILIADDEPDLEILIRQRFRRQIRDRQYDFVFARNGLEALERLRAEPDIELVLTDINMPEMDGLTLLGKLAEINPQMHSVVVSAYSDMTNIRTAMNRGAFDFLTKPIDFQDFEATVAKGLQQSRALKQAAQLREQLATVQRELGIAAHIQQSMLPRPLPPEMTGVEVHGIMLPAGNVGGDFYDFFPLDSGRLAFVVGDVSGKGVPSALFMMMSLTLLKAVAPYRSIPGACLTEVNRLLCRNHQTDLFVTMFYGVLDLDNGELLYANGAHNLPYRVSPGRLELLPEEHEGGVLGFREQTSFDTVQITLPPGEALFLYTDGVTEALDGQHQRYGTDRLEAHLLTNAGRPVRELVEGSVAAVRRFAGNTPQSDDLTALAVRRRP